MQIQRAEGVILQSLNFQDYDQILTVFTREEGLIKLIVKRARHAKSGRGGFTAPFTQAEFIYKEGRGEIFTCSEVSVIHQHLGLRRSLSVLEAACDIIKALLLVQPIQAAAPQLYDLLILYLTHIPRLRDPYALAASFRLKLLKHEGLLGNEIPDIIHRLAHVRTFAELEKIQLEPAMREGIRHFFVAHIGK